ncbi:UDP-N-acetylglucosamine 2-epimerase [Synechococcus sp. MU1650]|uniref:UDP-N-acetylglucosamine 2-epimerase n=1 Tax=Synechococcus sp. MU1650 TaxID=2508352 RepID=UPI001CF83B88|nr:UDP-N-acetylglucosamine 2-epimerase [Synechococcus sp. MU1650]MCB4378471.1 UDP-N-acetylglucosamine 2-epimerase (hydrolyzing) [Synechococcus sp. MU1650]
MSPNSRKVCVVTGTRAEYGLLRWVMQGIQDSAHLDLQLIVTGMHLSPEFGLTVQEIEADGFRIDRKIEMLLSSDTPVGISKSMGLAMIGCADALSDLEPDLLLILGDRFEAFSMAASAMIARIPIAHLHGGETTEGVVDESIRHSITKMAHIHFVAAEEYKYRVIQLGEQPENVFNVGALGVDNIKKLKLLDRNELEKQLDFRLSKKNLLITFHPVTLEKNTSSQQMNELLQALAKVEGTGLIFTMPNADTDSRTLVNQIKEFCKGNIRAKAFTSLGQIRYLSCMKHVDGVVGNSSSGILEAPTFQKGTINVGDRQKGRLKASSIIDCGSCEKDILEAIKKLYSVSFQEKLDRTVNPFGDGGASEAIVQELESVNLNDILKKKFYNVSIRLQGEKI